MDAILVKNVGASGLHFPLSPFFLLCPSGYKIKMNFRPQAIFSEFRFAFFSHVFPYNVNQLANKRNLDPRETTQRWVNFLESAV